MSNKTQLQTNNNALEALISRVNAAKDTAASLPEAGGGATLETVVIQVDSITEPGSMIYYLDESFSLHSEDITPNASYNILKNSIFFCSSYGAIPTGAQSIYGTSMWCVCLAIGQQGGLTNVKTN
jgi:hypothetical protein